MKYFSKIDLIWWSFQWVEPINPTLDVDPMVQGLCAFLLGTCYEFNRDPGEITRYVCSLFLSIFSTLICIRFYSNVNTEYRTSIHSILTRLGVDSLIGRMSRVKDDPRFRSINPEDMVISQSGGSGSEAEFEIWFDWGFIDFWKSNYCKQRCPALSLSRCTAYF